MKDRKIFVRAVAIVLAVIMAVSVLSALGYALAMRWNSKISMLLIQYAYFWLVRLKYNCIIYDKLDSFDLYYIIS